MANIIYNPRIVRDIENIAIRGDHDLHQYFSPEHGPFLHLEMLIYGVIGHGTFGVIFAARTRERVLGRYQHYAIKVQPYCPNRDEDSTLATVSYPRIDGRRWRTHREAFLLHFLRGNDRVSQLHSAYLHGPLAYIVMNQFGVDYDPSLDTLPAIDSVKNAPSVPGFNGLGLMRDKAPRLREQQVCKVVSHLTEALIFLNDRRMTHNDMSHRNYLIDENLNAQLIDFDSVRLAEVAARYRRYVMPHIYMLEHMISPELVLALTEYMIDPDEPRNEGEQKDVVIECDWRDEQLWKLGVITFELLHGYAPWDSPDPQAPAINIDTAALSDAELEIHKANREDRRDQIVNDPLPISDQLGLSQDCVDFLNAIFQKDPRQRPSIEELATFPWCQGSYVDSGEDYTRPPRI
ncbi:MAG: hypothetical protein M1830_010329 [Pleopsidium flavum]|nr:MAG: hypothetical protein M1830_010329 [Pleopsidium flavum]